MKSKTIRVLIPLAVIVIIAAGYFFYGSIGNLSAIGWKDISLLCPVGALSAMLASKTLIPRALISLGIVVVLILLVGRAFCGWICPVPLVSKLRGAFGKDTDGKEAKASAEVNLAPLTEEEQKSLKGCGSCKSHKVNIDSRHWILGGSLLSAAIFGFPVFCLICPIGLTFATIVLLFLLFGGGDVTWSVVFVPAVLLLEVVFFRKWCSHICPLSAFMSLISKGNKTFVPKVNAEKCLESKEGVHCGACAHACEQGINPAHPEKGVSFNECVKCRSCVDACPTKAITMPFIPGKKEEALPQVAE